MKLTRFLTKNKVSYGVIDYDDIFVVEGDIFDKFIITSKSYPLNEVRLLAPVTPGKIVCVGLNYLSHVQDRVGREVSDEPTIFMVSPTSITGPDEDIMIPYPDHTTHHEAELVVVIGKEARNVPYEKASDYIFGYTCGNDVSDRTLQKKDGQWTRAKSFNTFKPIGPYITTNIDMENCNVQARVNNKLIQNGNTNMLIRDVNQLISFISNIMTLDPGDLIMTGTPGAPGPIVPGDICEIIVGEMVLRNYVV